MPLRDPTWSTWSLLTHAHRITAYMLKLPEPGGPGLTAAETSRCCHILGFGAVCFHLGTVRANLALVTRTHLTPRH